MSTAADRLKAAGWLADVRPILAALGGAEGRSRAVGGAVRDTLLGLEKPVTDIDVATELVPEAVMELARKAGFTAVPTGLAHGTVTVVGAAIKAEVTTLRQDVETDGRRATVAFGTDWAADARRRDFTMNALYCDLDGVLFDPVGGLADCLARKVRFVGDPDRRIAEDRLRVLRYFRFCATHGEERFTDEALAACARLKGDLGPVSAERIGQEMTKLLAAPMVAETFRAMEGVGLFPALGLNPAAIAGVARLEAGGRRAAAAERLAVLGGDGAGLAALGRRWRLSGAQIAEAEGFLTFTPMVAARDWNRLRYFARGEAGGYLDFAFAMGAVGAAGRAAGAAALALPLPPECPVTGDDLIAAGFVPGKALGDALAVLREEWIASGFTLGREALLERVRR